MCINATNNDSIAHPSTTTIISHKIYHFIIYPKVSCFTLMEKDKIIVIFTFQGKDTGTRRVSYYISVYTHLHAALCMEVSFCAVKLRCSFCCNFYKGRRDWITFRKTVLRIRPSHFLFRSCMPITVLKTCAFSLKD